MFAFLHSDAEGADADVSTNYADCAVDDFATLCQVMKWYIRQEIR